MGPLAFWGLIAMAALALGSFGMLLGAARQIDRSLQPPDRRKVTK